MPRGDKDKYTDEQKRKAEHIEDSYKEKGVSEQEAEKRAWATVNKQSGGGEAGGSGEQKSGAAKHKSQQASAKRAAATRRGIPRRDSASLETKADLMQKARSKNIRGRSSMTKEQLQAALKKA
jgi:plasmid stabilization system protein ParE